MAGGVDRNQSESHDSRRELSDAVATMSTASRLPFVVFELQLERLRMQALAARQRRDGLKDQLDETSARAASVRAELDSIRARNDGALSRQSPR